VVEYTDDDLTGSRFLRVDLSGSRFHGVGLRNVKITDAYLENVEIGAEVRSLTVNGVDVMEFVNAELARRHPELRLLRSRDAADVRAAFASVTENAAATVARARALPEPALHESIDGEFSYIQTLRHLVFAADRWITGPVQGNPQPFHRLGYPHDDPSPWRGQLDLDARPSLDEVLALRGERLDVISELLRDADLERVVDSPNGGTVSVMDCIRVVLNEEWWHNRYATRDLEVLEGP
jgi:uncharacterized protein YjbI with pentapeptide repeats